MVSAPNVRSYLSMGSGGAEPPQDSILYEYKIELQMRNKKQFLYGTFENPTCAGRSVSYLSGGRVELVCSAEPTSGGHTNSS